MDYRFDCVAGVCLCGGGVTVSVITGDCLEVLRGMPDQSVHCCVTSPPYFGLRDYGHDGQIGLEASPLEYVARIALVFAELRRTMRDDGTLWLNLGDSYAGSWGAQGRPQGDGEMVTRSVASARQIAEHPRFDGLTGTRGKEMRLKPKDLMGIPWRVAFALQADGWYLRSDIIWAKPNPMPESVTDRPTKAHEYIFLLSKSERYFYDAAAIAEPLAYGSAERLSQPNIEDQAGSDRVPGKTNGAMKAVYREPYTSQSTKDYASSGAQDASATKARIVDRILAGEIITRNKRTVWTVTTKPFSGAHFATFPPDLIEPCIKAGCPVGGTVVDPFGGAGTTGLVADRLQRNAILIELNGAYAEMARQRIANDSPLFAEVQ